MQKSLKNKILILMCLAMLTACQSVKEQTSTLSKFFEALGSGDTSEIEKVDPNYCTDDGCPDFYKDDEEWDELEK
jgi:hypothetical protein|tara:strand:- start:18940 stop:19164 length:225 start_codon:yes stop_codon:yes gene_type:complete